MENIYSELVTCFRTCGVEHAVETSTAYYLPVVCLGGIPKRVIMGAISQFNLDAYISINGHSLEVTEDQVSKLLSDVGMMHTLEVYKMGNRAYFVFTNTPV